MPKPTVSHAKLLKTHLDAISDEYGHGDIYQLLIERLESEMSHYHQSHQTRKPRKTKTLSVGKLDEDHQQKVLTYGEIHLHIVEAVDALRARWPNDSDEQMLQRMLAAAKRIMEQRRAGAPMIFRRTDLVD